MKSQRSKFDSLEDTNTIHKLKITKSGNTSSLAWYTTIMNKHYINGSLDIQNPKGACFDPILENDEATSDKEMVTCPKCSQILMLGREMKKAQAFLDAQKVEV